jgi:hypothetical protein
MPRGLSALQSKTKSSAFWGGEVVQYGRFSSTSVRSMFCSLYTRFRANQQTPCTTIGVFFFVLFFSKQPHAYTHRPSSDFFSNASPSCSRPFLYFLFFAHCWCLTVESDLFGFFFVCVCVWGVRVDYMQSSVCA